MMRLHLIFAMCVDGNFKKQKMDFGNLKIRISGVMTERNKEDRGKREREDGVRRRFHCFYVLLI